jgi:hypothetical protein
MSNRGNVGLYGIPIAALLLGAGLLLGAASPSPQPAAATLVPEPPGTVVQDQPVYLGGGATHQQWHAVISKNRVGSSGSAEFYQWYLSLYAPGAQTQELKYRSPGNGGPLSTVEQAAGGAQMWYPNQTVQIVRSAELMQSGVQQLVVQSQESGADCGVATVTVFSIDAQGAVAPAVSVRNGCALTATIATGHGAVRDSIVLHGPYYSASAAMCCPTKPKATAVLSYRNGKWTQTPKYFAVYPSRFAPQ